MLFQEISYINSYPTTFISLCPRDCRNNSILISLLSCPLSPAHPHHARPIRQQTPQWKRISLDAFTLPANVAGSHVWQPQTEVIVNTCRGRLRSLGYEASCLALHQPTLPTHHVAHCYSTKLICRRCCRGWALCKRHKNCLATLQLHYPQKRCFFSFTEMHINPCRTWQTHTAQLLSFPPQVSNAECSLYQKCSDPVRQVVNS